MMRAPRCSAIRRPPMSIGAGLLVIVLLAAGLPCALVAQGRGHLAGEYGLWVTERGSGLHVGWLTETAVPGVLEVLRNGKLLHRIETPKSEAHEADFSRPRDGPLVLRYGTLTRPGGRGRYATTVYLSRREARSRDVLGGVDSLFVVGDVHGAYDPLRKLLEANGLVDARGRWTGGHKRVVFVGDLFDRGPDATKLLWFLYRLEHEADRAGGGVHVMLGNHETMVFTGDLRYTSPKERLIASLHRTTYTKLYDIRASVLGRWLRARPGLMKVGRVLLVHGGVTPSWDAYTVRSFNDSLRTFLAEDFFYYLKALSDPSDSSAVLVVDSSSVRRFPSSHVIVMDTAVVRRRLDFFFSDTSVFWYRGYLKPARVPRVPGTASDGSAVDSVSKATEAALALREADLSRVLKTYDVDLQVVGHTTGATIRSRFGGRLIDVDLDEPATEMLLLVRDGSGGYRAYRCTDEGVVGPPTVDDPAVGAGERE